MSTVITVKVNEEVTRVVVGEGASYTFSEVPRYFSKIYVKEALTVGQDFPYTSHGNVLTS